MASLDELIAESVNPFDRNLFTANFWHDRGQFETPVAAIHQAAIDEVEAIFAEVAAGGGSRTVLIVGDSGSGKSYLLGRLRHRLNARASFAYAGPWPDSELVWRHVLQQVIDSLMQPAQDGTAPQLHRWLCGLLVVWLKELERSGGRRSWPPGTTLRQAFIAAMRQAYPAVEGLYQPDKLFGVLFDLTDAALYPLATAWLRGDQLDDEDLAKLGGAPAIDSEAAARGLLISLGRLARHTRPMVLCFDQLDNIPRLPDGNIDLQALLNLNSVIHNEAVPSFLIIISLITETWRANRGRLIQADLARIHREITLQPIPLDAAEALWQARLAPLHALAEPKPDSPILPLSREALADAFPGGRALPRAVLQLGRQLLNARRGVAAPQPGAEAAGLRLAWNEQLRRVQSGLRKIGQIASPQLMRMLFEVLQTLNCQELLLDQLGERRYWLYSLGFRSRSGGGRIGVVWIEDESLRRLNTLLECCEAALERTPYETFYLLRAGALGRPANRGHRLHQKLFASNDPRRRHLVPDLASVQALAVHHALVNAVTSRELVVEDKNPSREELSALVRGSDVLKDCRLLVELGVLDDAGQVQDSPQEQAQRFILDLLATQQLLGRAALVASVRAGCEGLDETQAEHVVEQLLAEKRLRVLDAQAPREAQIVCLLPIG